jgi:hypothetical protein
LLDELSRAIEQLFGRLNGPMYFRFILQPIMAIIIAVRAGIRDARQNKPAFLSEVVSNPAERRSLIHSAFKDVMMLLCVAIVLDTVYQFLVLKSFYLLQALIVAFVLGVVPYVLFRGPIRRILRRKYSKSQHAETRNNLKS